MGKETPQAPDPYATAQAQTQSNEQTAQYQQQLNMIDSSSPYGTVNYTADPNAPGGYSQNTTLSPQEQALFNQSTSAQSGALGVANDQIGRVSQALGQTVTPGAMQTSVNSQPIQYGIDQGQPLQSSYNPGQAVQGSVSSGQPLQYGYNSGGQVQSGLGAQGNISTSYDPGGQIQTGVSSAAQGDQSVQNAANAAYQQQTQYLTPQYQQQTEELQSKLAAQGLNPNDLAYQNAVTLQNNQQNQGYQGAASAATAAGDAEQQALYNQALSSGQFTNSAQNQQNTQNAAAAAFQNSGQNQGYTQNLGSGNFANAAQAQQYGENQGQANFYNTAQNTDFSQGLQQGQYANSAAAQENAQNLSQANLANQAQAGQYSENLGSANLNNTAQNQGYNQGYQNATLGNTAEQQLFNQQAYGQELPINEFSALLGSGQVQSPTGINYTPSSVQSTNVAQIDQNSYQDAMQSSQANQNALGGLFNLGSSLMFM